MPRENLHRHRFRRQKREEPQQVERYRRIAP
jgi:hypothetical protein